MAGASPASEAIDAAAGETRTELAVVDFASVDTVEEPVVQIWTDAPTAELVLPEVNEEFTPPAGIEAPRDDFTPPNAPGISDQPLVESRKETPDADFALLETPGEAGGAEAQAGTIVVETHITQEKKEGTEN